MTTTLWILLAVLVFGWLILNLPRKRCDGDLLTNIHPYRKMLPYIMVGRNESYVLYDDYVRVQPLLDYIARAKEKLGFEVDITHCLVAACALSFPEQYKMNRFISGRRLYQRNHIAVTFSMKRARMDKEAKLSAVKLFFEKGETFDGICRRINEKIGVERSGTETYSDKELGIMTRLPRPLLSFAIRFVGWADYHCLLPKSFIDNDGFYTSIFIANLGSLGMRAGFHHLYDYGTCPLFMMVGKIEEKPWIVDGKVVPEKILHIRWSYDERIDDGLTSKYGLESVRFILEDPVKHFGSLEDTAPAPAPAPTPAEGAG
jgi:hypothetical protein